MINKQHRTWIHTNCILKKFYCLPISKTTGWDFSNSKGEKKVFHKLKVSDTSSKIHLFQDCPLKQYWSGLRPVKNRAGQSSAVEQQVHVNANLPKSPPPPPKKNQKKQKERKVMSVCFYTCSHQLFEELFSVFIITLLRSGRLRVLLHDWVDH